MRIIVDALGAPYAASREVEVVERKGSGHPDTICDALSETLSANLCRFYEERFGLILHHNVDKALLFGGASRAAFGGGEVLEPFALYLAGRAMRDVGGVRVPVEEMAIEGSREWLRKHLHALDPDRHAVVHCLVRPGSIDLVELFARQRQTGVFLSNDTSFGVGFAPLTELERTVIEVENAVGGAAAREGLLEAGEDVKVMGVRTGSSIRLTVACAMVGRFIADVADYMAKKQRLATIAGEAASRTTSMAVEIDVNTADDPAGNEVYLTVTGTSGEAGDDGQVGRGNRVNGLITPCRPMTLEAAAGKNPVTHVGKLYNVAAKRMAEAIIEAVPDVAEAHCFLVSQIGRPVSEPQSASVSLRTQDGRPVGEVAPRVEEIVRAELDRIDELSKEIVRGAVTLY